MQAHKRMCQMSLIFFRVLLIALLICLSAMKGDRKAWYYSKVSCLPTLDGGTAPVLIQCCADT